ncbi:hypothetical protein VV02_09810 [Luteipulveratus mongoliensis]|uniref:N-acetyltransferase domain-containing protein n=1 Tax=Luteipulveratus mongoliensis TaxID=571913 RepID=A0A0K1JQ05_9MICO|nr:hypothetical protein VV02_09810 [Luteipulveratus mongoliensis]
MTYRAERASDQAAVRRVVADAFADEGSQVAAFLDAMRASTHWVDLSFVAEDDSEVIGHISFSTCWLDTRRELLEVLTLSPVSVAPEHQGRGVGSGLIRWALAGLQDMSWPMIVLEGAPRYYGRFGFLPGEEHGLRRPSLRTPAPAFQVLPGSRREDWMTGTVVYPEYMWALDCVGLREPGLSEVERALGVS